MQSANTTLVHGLPRSKPQGSIGDDTCTRAPNKENNLS
ncbi:hypothetical protein NY08_5236 [Rhodococcus sp. B7740]|nr:hypothetical protein NY08_5236 [Rhodococcus sp. B7740]